MKRRSRSKRQPRRSGFTLLEIMLASSIFLGSVIVLGRLATIGRDHAVSADQLSRAQILCQTRLNEILAGIEPLEALSSEPMLEAPDWEISVEVGPTAHEQLSELKVTVALIIEPDSRRRKEQFSLTRWVPAALAGESGDSNNAFSPNDEQPTMNEGM